MFHTATSLHNVATKILTDSDDSDQPIEREGGEEKNSRKRKEAAQKLVCMWDLVLSDSCFEC